jgi:hypothetical protein
MVTAENLFFENKRQLIGCVNIVDGGHILLRDVYYQNSGNAIYSYQVRCMHVHVVTPGQHFYGLVMQGLKASSWRFKIGTNQLRETTPTENIGPPE